MELVFVCIFCRSDTNAFSSVEHILPTGLGNEDHVLPRGVVCDRCNHYFGSKVESPILSSGYFRNLRGRQALVGRSRNPIFSEATAFLGGAIFQAGYSASDELVAFDEVSVDGKTRLIDAYAVATKCSVWIPQCGTLPNEKIFSRFLAKVGLEIVAYRSLRRSNVLSLILDPEFDALRRWARYGDCTVSWPFHRRRIYPEEKLFESWESHSGYQLLHEFDILVTDDSEMYAVVCIFGEEFVINLGGPELEGYHFWLKTHRHRSPLYTGKNASKDNVTS